MNSKKNINFYNLMIFILVTIILYQDSIVQLTKINFLNYIDEFFVFFTFVFSILKSKGKINKEGIKIFLWSILFLSIGIVSGILNSNYDTFSLIMGGILFLKLFLLIISSMFFPYSDKFANSLINAIKINGWIALITGVINVVLPNIWTTIIPYTYIYKRLGITSAMGLFIHAGQYGWFLLFSAIIYYAEWSKTEKKSNIISFVLLSIGALLSLKTKVIVSIVAILAFDIYFNNSKSIKKFNLKKLILVMIIIIVVLTLFGTQVKQTFSQYLTSNGDSTSARYALLEGSIKIANDYFPIGVGFAKWGSYYAKKNYSEFYYKYGVSKVYGLEYGKTFFGTDTFWPAIIGETGYLGFIIYIFLLFKIFNILRKNRSNDNYFMSLGICVFIQAIVESFGEPIFNSSPQNILIALIIGVCISDYYLGRKDNNDKN